MNDLNLYFVRHGAKERGTNPPLSREGRAQARRVRRRMIRLGTEKIYCSDHLRTVQTGEIMNRFARLPLERTPVLREMDFGEYDRLSREEFCRKYPDFGADKPYYLDERDLPYPGGESSGQVLERIVPFVDSLCRGHDEAVVLVTSAGLIRIFIAHILGMDMGKRMRLGNPPGLASLTHVIYSRENDRFILKSFNDCSHLK